MKNRNGKRKPYSLAHKDGRNIGACWHYPDGVFFAARKELMVIDFPGILLGRTPEALSAKLATHGIMEEPTNAVQTHDD